MGRVLSFGRHRGTYDQQRDMLASLMFRTEFGRHRGNPDVGPRCGECRLGLGSHNTADPLCDHHER